MATVITINVGGRLVITLESTLRQSPFLAKLLFADWAPTAAHVNGSLFIDADPILFEHVLNFLRRLFPPIFWSRTDGFDFALYLRLLNEAEYFQLDALADWIRERKKVFSLPPVVLIGPGIRH
ncbi:hypothetical protein B0A48_18446 [Cryoendolithus antarcticus]|uniref:BTB domain-containing protein n=1 Tax=Cryoendolithus antarcticus TaxID=1507870 RepID=A0A1V8S900_9PEZI|nr:hypothetical protein B0A48_18446 [Cryoendolithus antarcticus]